MKNWLVSCWSVFRNIGDWSVRNQVRKEREDEDLATHVWYVILAFLPNTIEEGAEIDFRALTYYVEMFNLYLHPSLDDCPPQAYKP